MKVILLKDISGVGRKYDVKDVAEGHAQNFLFPRKMAVWATNAEIKKLESEKMKAEGERKVQEELLEKNIESLSGVKVVMKEKANEQGHLFAGINKEKVLKALKEQTHLEFPSEYIDLPGHIKSIGVHKIPVRFGNKKGEFELAVEGE